MVVGRKQRRVERHPVEFVRLLLLADDFALFEPQQRIPYLHGTGIGHAGLGVAVQPAEHVRPFLVAIREVHAGHGVVFGGADQRIREGQGLAYSPCPTHRDNLAVVAHAGEVEPVGLVRTDEPALQEKVHAGRTPEFVVALGLQRLRRCGAENRERQAYCREEYRSARAHGLAGIVKMKRAPAVYASSRDMLPERCRAIRRHKARLSPGVAFESSEGMPKMSLRFSGGMPQPVSATATKTRSSPRRSHSRLIVLPA